LSLLGVFFYKVGVGEAVDDVLSERAPFYSKFINPNMRLWNQPEHGLLSGRINKVNSQYEFELRDIDNKNWIIFHDKKTVILMKKIEEGTRANLIGETMSPDGFRVEIIKPMGAGRGFLNRAMDDARYELRENSKLFEERIELMPKMFNLHPEMKEVLRDHLQRHQQELDNFLLERPDLSNDFEEFRVNIENQ